ncbi:matrix metalloproteinase-21-like isoform X2 [Stegostoma tigrinum]|uniref:matrix metalloproteinase-21-like isoform X2 n=1 Tax=Stegostoma tigrinum TaxID=3053191 RepID=UPI0028706B54|nr:matrix metalloproteinase-21-like isoform X2 [Stegostoma tigrinum]
MQTPRGASLLAVCLCLLAVSVGEKVYHSRDHSDIQERAWTRARPVLTTKSAQEYLDKYGWTEPVNWEDLAYQGVSVPLDDDPSPLDISGLLLEGHYSRRHVKEQEQSQQMLGKYTSALLRFQTANGIPVTGILDAATKEAMNLPRCGVPDHKAHDNGTEGPNGTAGGNADWLLGYRDTTAAPGVSRPVDVETARPGVMARHLLPRAGDAPRSPTEDTSSEQLAKSERVRAEAASDHSGSADPGAGQRPRFIQWLVDGLRKKRRSSDLLDSSLPTLAFSKTRLKWRILDEGYSSQLTIDDQKTILRLAFRMWSEVTPLMFEEDLTSPASEIDIRLGFGTKRHLGCSQVFDGTGQEYAHAWRLGDVHFDDDEHFVTPSSSEGISLLTVAVHEIGHVLGLPHIRRPGSIMHPNYIPQDSKDLELDWYDRKAIQQIYGVCEGSFSTVFDWVRREENEFGEARYRFNTYFLRHGWYWMYENRFNRTRYGDPIPLVVGWRGLPSSDIDGFVHIWTWNKDVTLFFKGDCVQCGSEQHGAWVPAEDRGCLPGCGEGEPPGGERGCGVFLVHTHLSVCLQGHSVLEGGQ